MIPEFAPSLMAGFTITYGIDKDAMVVQNRNRIFMNGINLTAKVTAKIALFVALLAVVYCNPPEVFADLQSAETDSAPINPAVTEWFEKYDEIRRSAEMKTSEKLKYGSSLKKALKSGGRLSPTTKEFIERMKTKYAAAYTSLLSLQTPAETRDLQRGYAQYFKDMEESFGGCLDAQELSAEETAAKVEKKEKIEALNSANKKLDEGLRKKFGIPKHKHI